ncbi:MAG: ATP-grasp domain-containing protein [Candidatus Saccharimonadales bacterium]
MPIGEYIKDRWIVKTIKNICQVLGIEYASYSDNWLLELTKNEVTHRIIGYKFDLNNGVAALSSEDKVVAYTILSAHNVPAIPHALARTKVISYSQWQQNGWHDIVVKPLAGTSGHNVQLFHSESEAAEWIESQDSDAWAVSPFVNIKREIRLIVLKNEILLTYEKEAVTINGLRMFNLGLGATPKNTVVSEEINALAKKAFNALDLQLGAVDIVELEDGRLMVLEVNDGVMMEHYARASKENEDNAYAVYKAIISEVMK